LARESNLVLKLRVNANIYCVNIVNKIQIAMVISNVVNKILSAILTPKATDINHLKQAHQQQNAANPSLNMIEQFTQQRGNTL
jgi:2-C-methyl-D-erythritol 4-phosphate cytidylyltransferase